MRLRTRYPLAHDVNEGETLSHPYSRLCVFHHPVDPVARSMLEHQWRTPLTAIRSAAEILRDQPDLTPVERNELLDALLAETARLNVNLERYLTRLAYLSEPFDGHGSNGCIPTTGAGGHRDLEAATSGGRRYGP